MSGTCVGSECHSFECTRIGLKECQCAVIDQNFCETCCVDSNGTCLPSRIFSNILIKTNPNFTLQSGIVFVNVTLQEIETICNDKMCFHLNFHRFQQSSFCTRLGKVGICAKSRCVLPDYVAARAPQIRTDNTNDSVNMFVYTRLWIILISIYTFL